MDTRWDATEREQAATPQGLSGAEPRQETEEEAAETQAFFDAVDCIVRAKGALMSALADATASEETLCGT